MSFALARRPGVSPFLALGTPPSRLRCGGAGAAVTITGKTKRQIQEIFRRHGQIRNFVLFTFCAGLASLFRRIPHLGSVTIDEEYTGKNFVIKKITLQMLEKTKHVPDIRFGRIGKKHWRITEHMQLPQPQHSFELGKLQHFASRYLPSLCPYNRKQH